MEITVSSPFPPQAWPRVWSWMQPFRDRVSDDFCPKTQDDFVARMLEQEATIRTWAIYADGELGGLISYERLSPWLGTAHFAFKPGFQGKGIASKAAREVLALVFADGIGKLTFYPLAGNNAIGSLLVSLGAKREGCLRAQTVCNGKPAAINIYGLLREEFEHALGSYNSSDHRSGNVDSGVVHVGKAEDLDPDQHPNAAPGTPGPAKPD